MTLRHAFDIPETGSDLERSDIYVIETRKKYKALTH